MRILNGGLGLALLVVVGTASAAQLSLDQNVHLSFVNAQAVNDLPNAGRKSAELAPGRYQIVVRYGNSETFKRNPRPYHSVPNMLTIDVDDRDIQLRLPSSYRNAQTARYHFERTPTWFAKYSDGEELKLSVEKISGTIMEYDAKIMAAYEQFKLAN